MFTKAIKSVLRDPAGVVGALASDPLEAWASLQDRILAVRERPAPADLYRAEPDWEARLHARLEKPWPCAERLEFWSLLPTVIAELEAKGLRVGPFSFKGWNDGDPGFVRAIWCLVRHLRPANVVETGVAHGMTSRFILEAMERNGAGRLWSIDHPPLEQELHAQIGVAVGDVGRHRWQLISGSSRRQLPPLLRRLGMVDLFVHDSLHSERNVRLELDHVWPLLSLGGAVVVDDIDSNWGFRSFREAHPDQVAFVCEAEPLHPDPRRFNQKGLFGIMIKSHPTGS